eukprot:TRINITY_DN3218_c0_g3_i1.p1 TRINITY_DN3218_c0_g3~~TRINITY_DN3218_c0_g3_i1.p1  ORF type:complete len:225 (-),score=21.59 TRINITY_DN3218_c0_g3_i1:131-805(-)
MVHITYGQGQYTQVIYSKIKDGKLEEAIEILRQKLQESPDNRAALSLLGYCFYQLGNYEEAGQMYEKLTGLFPENPEYLFYYAQCLYKEGIYDEASRIVQSIQGQHMKDLTSLLNVAITYEQDNVPVCRQLLDRCPKDSSQTIINQGCVLYKEGKYEEARSKFHTAMGMVGFKADLVHNIALCHYRMKQYGAALKNIAEIIEKGVREHPELGIGSSSEGMEMRS